MLFHKSFILYSFKVVWKRWSFKIIHPVLRVVTMIVRESYIVLLLAYIMSGTGSIGGWSLCEMLLSQSFISMSYALLVLVFSGIRDFRLIGKKRKLDIALLRPKGVLLQILLDDSDWFAVAGHAALGIGLLLYCMEQMHIRVTVEKIIVLLCNLLGAVLIQAALWLMLAALECFIQNVTNIKRLLFWIPREFLRLPLCIYPMAFRWFFVYVAPFAFVSYFPVLDLLEKVDSAYPPWFCRFSLPLGIGMYMIAYGCWRIGLNRYRKG